ncbi:stress protein [Bacteroides sp. CAG:770]|nr:stress protein [Bacteroides sp. CAG:770]
MTIPVVFAFDKNLVMPACVCISSLLMNAKKDTSYDIFILHPANQSMTQTDLVKLSEYYDNCKLTFRPVGNEFDNAFEIRGITTPAYYRLLIPEIIPEYDKIIYSDVDVIFRRDLSDLYSIDLAGVYMAATYDVGMNLGKDGVAHISATKGLVLGKYIQSGFIMLNSSKLKNDGLVIRFKEEAKKQYKFQDQDILNVVCGKNLKVLPAEYNMTDYTFYYLNSGDELIKSGYVKEEEISEAKQYGTLHFNGHKPWESYSINFDIWWEYYRKSPFFDEKFYFDFFYRKINDYDLLPLWKRVKILLRYFVFGRRIV